MNEFRIEWIDDETVTFLVNDEEVGYADHDLHGWDGIEAAIGLFRSTAVALKIDLVEE